MTKGPSRDRQSWGCRRVIRLCPNSAFATGGAEDVRKLGDLVARGKRALPRKDRHARAGVENGGFQLVGRRRRQWRAPGRRRTCARVAHRVLVGRQLHQLHILANCEMGDAAIAQSRATGPVRDQNGVLRPGHFLVVDGERLHEFYGIDALLIADTAKIVERQSGGATPVGLAVCTIWYSMPRCSMPNAE
jgi:hypothetical protein